MYRLNCFILYLSLFLSYVRLYVVVLLEFSEDVKIDDLLDALNHATLEYGLFVLAVNLIALQELHPPFGTIAIGHVDEP